MDLPPVPQPRPLPPATAAQPAPPQPPPPPSHQHQQQQQQQPVGRAKSEEGAAEKQKRVNQACFVCRKRKSRCHLEYENGAVKLPCQRCKRENLECVLGGSNRGGRRVRRKTLQDPSESAPAPPPRQYPLPLVENVNVGFHGIGTMGTTPDSTSPTDHRPGLPSFHGNIRPADEPPGRQSDSSTMDFQNLQNPSDALGILAQVAEEGTSAQRDGPQHYRQRSSGHGRIPEPLHTSYRPLAEGKLTFTKVAQLVQRYHQCYHPYFPLPPPETFDPSRLQDLAQKEPHLLTAILVIACKDLLEETQTYDVCSNYMTTLISELVAGGTADVEAVEGLLLLSEWTPYTQRAQSGDKVGKGEEDREAWMKCGLALRHAYYLGLEQYSFRGPEASRDPQFSRKLLAWTACYIEDRQVSIRVGKAFWSRGPGPLTSLRRESYPSLLPRSPNDDDHASIFQATLELTQIFGNVHDVLYSNVGTSFRSNLFGSYIKFIDDFRAAIYGWKSVWGSLTCSPNLKAMLLLSYDYLRLYTNSFAFQATTRGRASPAFSEENPASNAHQHNSNPTTFATPTPTPTTSTLPPITHPQSQNQHPSRMLYNNVAAVGDARFIYEALDAAKAILSTVNNWVDPEKVLRFMPLRFYLYMVYAGVFLYRAKCCGVLGTEEERNVRRLVSETVERLRRSGVGTLHLGRRYSELLKLLWEKADARPARRGTRASVSVSGLNNAQSNGNSSTATTSTSAAGAAGAGAVQPPSAPPPRFGPNDAATTLVNVHAHPTPSTTIPSHSSHSVDGGAAESPLPLPLEQAGDFRWTDLSAVGDFAVNGYAAGSLAPGEEAAMWSGFLPLDMGGNWDVGTLGQFDGVGEFGMGF